MTAPALPLLHTRLQQPMLRPQLVQRGGAPWAPPCLDPWGHRTKTPSEATPGRASDGSQAEVLPICAMTCKGRAC